MLDIVLHILSILGISLLVVVGLLLVVVLLILFFPVSYKLSGQKKSEISASVKINWLFGLLRARFLYPEPGKLIVKLLCFTVYDSSVEKMEKNSKKETNAPEHSSQNSTTTLNTLSNNPRKNETSARGETVAQEETAVQQEKAVQEETAIQQEQEVQEETTIQQEKTAQEKTVVQQEKEVHEENTKKGLFHFITSKYEKIKYTILRIYDKIKHIWENISFYKNLFQEEQTQGLLKHVGKRLKKIWKNIHPRKLKAEISFGTGSPDTTGYIMGIYGIFSPVLGKNVIVNPNFNEAVLEGDFYAAGHITAFQLILHTLMVLLDKRLRILLHKIKKYNSPDT